MKEKKNRNSRLRESPGVEGAERPSPGTGVNRPRIFPPKTKERAQGYPPIPTSARNSPSFARKREAKVHKCHVNNSN